MLSISWKLNTFMAPEGSENMTMSPLNWDLVTVPPQSVFWGSMNFTVTAARWFKAVNVGDLWRGGIVLFIVGSWGLGKWGPERSGPREGG